MLTGVAIYHGPRITGPVPYAWVFVVVFLALIALIFFRVYGRGNEPGRQAGHHSRRRNAHKSGHTTAHTSGHATAHTSGHATEHTSGQATAHTSEHGTTHGASQAPGKAEKHGHRAASRRRQHRP
jgi:hypothetical protein